MGVLLTLITGLVLWIVLWAIGVKSIDAFLITLVMLLVAAAAHIIWPTLPGNRDRDRRPS
jgi:Mn2+/Fe2+ NRAMP family transporter